MLDMDSPLSEKKFPEEVRPRPIGIIIPTFNRLQILLSCLQHLEVQTWKDFEVIIVDDGSTDATPQLIAEYQRKSPLHIQYIWQKNAGQGSARNKAVSVLRAPICLMIGDDILCAPNLVYAHLQLHNRRPGMEVAGLGFTQWSDSGQKVTRFMRWLDESGIQFAYKDLFRGVSPSWKHFYTSNLSMKTSLLQANLFDESFTRYGMEDMELAYRLEQQGPFELVFIPDAIAHHVHPTTFRQACKRMFNVGLSTHHFHELWPTSVESSRSSILRRIGRDILLEQNWLLSVLTWLADRLTKLWCPNPLMRYALSAHFVRGYRSSGTVCR
jgi:glycosyltransferase involved in cell wall biosynthesis